MSTIVFHLPFMYQSIHSQTIAYSTGLVLQEWIKVTAIINVTHNFWEMCFKPTKQTGTHIIVLPIIRCNCIHNFSIILVKFSAQSKTITVNLV